MRCWRLVIVGFVAIGLWLPAAAQQPAQTGWRCMAGPIEPCVRRHGRLSSQNGIGLKIWLIGTTRVVGLENAFDELPAVVQRYLNMTSPDHSYIYGDFDICPLEPDTPGTLRRVCVTGAEKLVVKNLRGERPPFRLLSTWPSSTRLGPDSVAERGP